MHQQWVVRIWACFVGGVCFRLNGAVLQTMVLSESLIAKPAYEPKAPRSTLFVPLGLAEPSLAP
jgi:hypothetical protein